jgi:spermidine synthase
MKPRIRIASTTSPDGSEVVLHQHDGDFTISVDRHELMLSRAHESEQELARLGCARIAQHRNPAVLIGGLGMGYTLRQALDLLPPQAAVVVAELLPEVVRWNRDYLGELNRHPLRDPRVEVRICDVARLIRGSPGTFDAILLDIDNGTSAITDAGNDRLYSRQGIRSCMDALHAKGCLAIWSAFVDLPFERRLRQEQLAMRRVRVPARMGGKSRNHCIWLVSRTTGVLIRDD